MKRLSDFFNVTPLKFFQDNRRDLCSQVQGCVSGGGGGLTQVYTTNSASITWTGTGTQADPLIGTAVGSSGANPSTSVGLTASNGVATTFMRSDAAPALSQAITPTWTGQHKFTFGANPTGNETIKLANDAAWISFYNTADTTRTGYFQMRVSTGMIIGTEIAQPVQILAGNAVRHTISATGVTTIPGNVNIGSTGSGKLNVGNGTSAITSTGNNEGITITSATSTFNRLYFENLGATAGSRVFAFDNTAGVFSLGSYTDIATGTVVASIINMAHATGIIGTASDLNVGRNITALNLSWTSSTGTLLLGTTSTGATLTAAASATGSAAGNIGLFGGNNTSTGAGGTAELVGGDAVTAGGAITIAAGDTTGNGSTGGSVLIASGQGAGSASTGGNLTIRASDGTGTSGSIILQTAPPGGANTNRLVINGAGAWLVNATAGTAGQALTSAGAGSTPTWSTVITAANYTGGKQSFTADGTTTVVTITHNMALASSGGGQFMPTAFSLTTTEPISQNHLNRTITFPTTNTMVITFNIAPIVGENANYIWTILR